MGSTTYASSSCRVDNTLLATLASYDSGASEDWLWNPGAADLSAYAGQTVKVRFQAKNDMNNPTSFFVDDVSAQACAASNTPSPTLSPTNTPTPRPTATPGARLYLPVILK